MELRPYQREAKEAILKDWDEGAKKLLLVLPTGTGKTIVFSEIAKNRVNKGDRVLVLAHRGELLDQAKEKITKTTGLSCATEKAQETCIGSNDRVVVGSIQSMQRGERLERFKNNYFDTIIIDEAHHALSSGYEKTLDYFNNANVLGVTATPDRGDMKDLGKVFEKISYEYSLASAIKEGYLSPIKAMTIPLDIDLSNVGMAQGDFKAGEIETALDPHLEQIAIEMKKYCKNRKTVVFLPLIKTSKKFTTILNYYGFKAVEVNGNSQDREEKLKDFNEGKYNVLCNSMLLTEGWDCPSVDCVIVLRPTKIRSLYCQMIGRGTRLAEGKKDLLVLDFLWHTEKHDLCHPASLICANEEVAKRMTKSLEENPGKSMDIEEAEKKAEEDVLKEREEALAKELEAHRKKKRKLVDPLQFELSIQDIDLANYVPIFGWEREPITEKQRETLEKMGVSCESVESKGKASLLLGKLFKRKKLKLSTPKQISCLERYGFQHVGTWSCDDASAMISRISKNRWRVPYDINPALYAPQEVSY